MAPWFLRIAAAAALFKGFSEHTLSLVSENMLSISTHSWELGTAAQALTEAFTPGLSVFESTAFPPPSFLNRSWTPTSVLTIVDETLSRKPASSGPLFANEGSAADPASLGSAVLLAHWTRTDARDYTYADAAQGQLDYLLRDAPRSAQGAISHRADEVQLWSDFVYMVPPFIAYHGALHGSQAVMQEAYDQCRLYRDGLRDANGLWRHVDLGHWQDRTHWATGNGWAAAGMLRVLSTLNHTSSGYEFEDQQSDLASWVHEILETAWSHQSDNGAIHNVVDDPATFTDTASTALLAASTYRYASLTHDLSLIRFADAAFAYIQQNLTPDGWLAGAVNPMTFHDQLPTGTYSPEGQAFVLLLQAARKAFAEDILFGRIQESNIITM